MNEFKHRGDTVGKKLGFRDANEELTFAIEDLIVDVQYTIQRLMEERGMNRTQLAKKMGVSAGWVTQMLSEESNLTVETIAKALFALGDKGRLQSEYLEGQKRKAAEQLSEVAEKAWQKQFEVQIAQSKGVDLDSTKRIVQLLQECCSEKESKPNNENLDKQQPIAGKLLEPVAA